MIEPTGYTALDLIGYTDRGVYNASANYVKNDLVHYQGDIWRVLVDDTTGVIPSEGLNYTIYIEAPTDVALDLIARRESVTSTHAYAVGDQLIYNNTLYKVTSAIAVGDTLAVGTNIAAADTVTKQIEDQAFADLSDTAITTPTDGQIPVYDGTAGKWKNTSVDSSPSLTSALPLQNQKVTKLVGIEIGPVRSNSTGAATGKTLVTFTHSLITTAAEVHLIQDNGAGSPNVDTSSYDTPVYYNSMTLDAANNTVTYEFNDGTLVQATNFYLRVISEFMAVSPT